MFEVLSEGVFWAQNIDEQVGFRFIAEKYQSTLALASFSTTSTQSLPFLGGVNLFFLPFDLR